MYRVELKEFREWLEGLGFRVFLMYRVELKDLQGEGRKTPKHQVPNVPCGVERLHTHGFNPPSFPSVPNVPCGVESYPGLFIDISLFNCS